MKLPVDITETHYTAAGELDWKMNDTYVEGFTGSLDEDLEGDGFLNNSLTRINWETQW